MYLVSHPVYVRQDAGYDRKASFLHYVLTLILCQMLLMYKAFFLYAATLIIERHQVHSVFYGPRKIRKDQIQQHTLLLRQRSVQA